jgi:L,D-transpeptidase catalytic domain
MDYSETEGPSSEGSRASSLVGAGLRAALASGAAMAMVLAALGSAHAAMQRPPHPKREQAKKPAPPKPLEMPLIEVSISKQQLTLYDKGEVVAHAPVSTGMAGHSTPTGIFSVIGKEIFHRSNIYSGAPMPYMQRITWSGVALHAGVLPGYPASHGCIRMPHEFAVRLYGLTRRGARVLVMPHEVAPVAFESARLFTRPKPAADKTSEAILPAPVAPDLKVLRVRTAESQQPSVMSDAVDPAAHALAGMDKPKPAEVPAVPPPVAAPMQVSEPPATPAAAQATIEAGESAKAAAAMPAEKTTGEPAADGPKRAAATAATEAAEAPKYAASGAQAEASTGTVVVKPVPVTAAQPIEVQKTFEPVGAPRQGTETFQPVPTSPAVQPAQAAQPAPAPEVKPAPAAAAADEFYGPERPLRPGPITVFVSKKEGKVFIRKGFQPVFSWPVKFEHPEVPLGTHLYTAVEANSDGVSYRWQVVSLPTGAARKVEVRVTRDKKGRGVEKVVHPAVTLPVATPAEALDRVDIPPVALSRISALMSAGASLIISDQGLGSETGTETDFIVLTR